MSLCNCAAAAHGGQRAAAARNEPRPGQGARLCTARTTHSRTPAGLGLLARAGGLRAASHLVTVLSAPLLVHPLEARLGLGRGRQRRHQCCEARAGPLRCRGGRRLLLARGGRLRRACAHRCRLLRAARCRLVIVLLLLLLGLGGRLAQLFRLIWHLLRRLRRLVAAILLLLAAVLAILLLLLPPLLLGLLAPSQLAEFRVHLGRALGLALGSRAAGRGPHGRRSRRLARRRSRRSRRGRCRRRSRRKLRARARASATCRPHACAAVLTLHARLVRGTCALRARGLACQRLWLRHIPL